MIQLSNHEESEKKQVAIIVIIPGNHHLYENTF